MATDTPLMTQYKEIKSQNEDSILFFRLGDFYEMFFQDAVTASKELGLTLTSRNKEKGQNVPLAGIPFHSAASYIAKLVNKGYKVAICEQVEDPKAAKGIVKREVIRVITPGTVIDTDYLDEKSNNYLMGLVLKNDSIGLSYVDITTGEFKTTEMKGEDLIYRLLGEINKISPKEIIIDEESFSEIREDLEKFTQTNGINIHEYPLVKKPEDYIKNYFKILSLESFSLENKDRAVESSAMVLDYILDLQKGKELPVDRISYTRNDLIMELNLTTQRNLDIISNAKEQGTMGTLLWVLDQCKSSMGSRLLKKFIKNPLLDIEEINKRQEHIDYFMKEVLIREELRDNLKNVYDIERIIGKLVLETVNGRDLVALKVSIKNALEIYKFLNGNPIFDIDIKKLVEIHNLIEKIIVEEPPFSVREGGMIKAGYNKELDEFHSISKTGKNYILDLEAREKEKTGIKTLKIKYNKVFGYFIEVTKSNAHLVPENYIRRQTLSNGERYIIEELKEYEDKVINAKERIETLEYYLFRELYLQLKEEREILQDLAYKLAYLDVITNFAHIAIKNNYCKPEITEGFDLEILGGRHAIIEKLIKSGDFVKNNVIFQKNKNMIILTGPNMSGKSTYMKQIALIIIMAHIGCYVPADYAKISLTDRVFTRIGASDDLLTGQSTFMLEMSEVANIVNSATKKSFIILDEIGRGTSTFDGISIATAITEYIHNNIGSKTIFATHYHELTQLEERLENSENFRIEVKETGDEIIFSREIVKGGADKSYGIEVARLAGLPKEILDRAKGMLKSLEERKAIVDDKLKGEQLMLFGSTLEEEKVEEAIVKEEEVSREDKIALRLLKEVDLNNLTPMEALIKLNELKRILN
ncbi:MAG: DNA mismatch repair protein MutS [Cetobacterium sp.]|uniref:DNA mismatch repair protein MutS n=1 Tax=Cetobacterium sp. TaxID=2071632 RepID=UPI003F2EA770